MIGGGHADDNGAMVVFRGLAVGVFEDWYVISLFEHVFLTYNVVQ